MLQEVQKIENRVDNLSKDMQGDWMSLDKLEDKKVREQSFEFLSELKQCTRELQYLQQSLHSIPDVDDMDISPG